MGRIRAVAAHKVKKNRPVTRIGRKAYRKRRHLAEHKLEIAGHDNPLTQLIMKQAEREGEPEEDPYEPVDQNKQHARGTPLQHYTRVGLTMDPSMSEYNKTQRKKSVVKAKIKREKLPKPEEEIKPPRMVTDTESTMLNNLMAKHSTNFKAMSLDYKLNPFQLTPKQLQRKLANYLRLEKSAFPDEYAEMQEQGILLDDPSVMDKRRRQRPEYNEEDDE